MNIAVIYSGLVRPEKNLYKDNIWKMHTLLPDADFFYTTWENTFEGEWIDNYYPEPKLHYNCEQHIILESLKTFRKMRDEGDTDNMKFKKARYRISEEGRRRSRRLIMQHLAHAHAVEDYSTGAYDIIIRVRYDLKFDKEFNSETINKMIQTCYETERPVSIGMIDPDQFPPGEMRLVADPFTAMGDFLIVHRADKFDPQIVWDLYKNKELKAGEAGWYQIMCEPYHKESYVFNQMLAKI